MSRGNIVPEFLAKQSAIASLAAVLATGCAFEADLELLVIPTIPPQPFSAFAPTQPMITDLSQQTATSLEMRELDELSLSSGLPSYLQV